MTTRATVEGLHHAGLMTSDLARSDAFYGGILGLEKLARPPAMVARVRESWFRAGRSQVQIREGKVDKSMAFHFALYVAPDAYEAFIEHLRAEKVRFNSEPRVFEDGFRRCTVFDPDDNMIEIADEKPA